MTTKAREEWTAWTDGGHTVIDGPEDDRGRVEQIATVHGDDHAERGKKMAAAPDLLEALRGVAADLRLICKARGIAYPRTLDAADAAIAKATGD